MDTIKFAKVRENAIIPSKDVENAGYDIYGIFEGNNDENRIVKPHTTKLIPTGIACALPSKYYFQVEERGSTGSKGIKKSAGVIDSGYRGEIFIAITNSTNNYLVFGDKDSYIAEAKAELQKWQNIDENNMTDEDKISLEEALVKSIGEESYNNLEDNVKEDCLKELVKLIKHPASTEEFESNLQTAIFYPDTKAIAQLVLHEVPVVNIEEISYEDLKKIPSERMDGKLGSSGK
jgi:dUTP pyrophosphatase